MKKKSSESRRKFLLKGFSNRDQLFSDIAAIMREEGQQGDKIKMLTSDGKLVEVERRVLEDLPSSAKTSNAEILEWMKGEQKK